MKKKRIFEANPFFFIFFIV